MAILKVVTIIYLVSLSCSLGVMEISSTLLILGFLAWKTWPRGESTAQGFHFTTPVGFWPALGLLITAIVSALWNELPRADFLHGVGKLRWVLTYYFIHNAFVAIKIPENLPKWVLQLSPFLLLVAIYAISQFWTGMDLVRGDSFSMSIALKPSADLSLMRWRSAGLFSSPLTYGYSFAGLSCVLLGLILAGSKNKAPQRKNLFLILTLATLLVSLGTTYTRGVWLAVLGGIFVVMFSEHKKAFLIGSSLALLAMIAYLPFNPALQERVLSIFDPQYTSNSERLSIWMANIYMFLDSPWLGVGYEYSDRLIGTYFKKLNIVNVPESHAHNTYLHFLAGTGILGLGFFLSFLWQLFRANLKLIKTVDNKFFFVGILGLHSTILIGGLTECAFKDAEINHMFIFFAAVVSAAYQIRFHQAQSGETASHP